jgi:hypothetical protein
MTTAMIGFERYARTTGHIAPGGFEHSIDLAGRPEDGEEFASTSIEAMRTEVMEHDATVVEQRLDVDELERRVMILDHTLAEFKTPRSF